MEPEILELYALGDLTISGGTISLVAGYDGSNDPILTLFDDDNAFDGDSFNDENGNDPNQFGTVDFPDGTTLGGPSVTVFSEVQATLTAPDGSTILLLQVEVDNPTGTATIAGFLPSIPLERGVTYTFTVANTTPANATATDELLGAICFTAGNMIQTDQGEVRATDLGVGMMVKTMNNGFQPLRWIYRRTVTGSDMAKHPELRPISFAPNSLGPSLPDKQMKLSPQHKLWINSPLNALYCEYDTLLISAKHLTNGTTIKVDHTTQGEEYIHLLFDCHEIIYADGVETESFNPGEWAMGLMEAEAKLELDIQFPHLRDINMLPGFNLYPTVKTHEALVISRAFA